MKDVITQKEADYARRFARVLDHIDAHLDGELSVETLARVAHFSKFHFHRQFTHYCGVSVIRYVQLMRLKRAAYRLAFNPRALIIDIALDCGFDSPESFTRAFKNAFGQTPRAFRNSPDWASWSARCDIAPKFSRRRMNMDVEIVETRSALVAALEHAGAPATVNHSVQRFLEWRATSGQPPIAECEVFGVPHNDPNVTAPEAFRFDICASTTQPPAANAFGVVAKTIPGGRCARTLHRGSREQISETVYALYREWLPDSGEELRDFPVYFRYLNLDFDTPEHLRLTEVYLPLQ
jgi:AraC family transcriptional regulator